MLILALWVVTSVMLMLLWIAYRRYLGTYSVDDAAWPSQSKPTQSVGGIVGG